MFPGFNFGATGISMDSGAGKLYVSNLMGQLFVVDIGTLAITDRFEVQGDQLLNLVVDHDNKRLLAVVLLDLDHFRSLIDAQGDHAGDEALHYFAAAMFRTNQKVHR